MSFVVGVLLALGVGGLTTGFGMDRDRALYPAVMMVIAAYYVLFALMGGSLQVLIVECAVAAVFIGFALAGFKMTLWLVVAALAAHGVFDVIHPHIYANSGVPAWWPPFCIGYDVVAAAYLAWCLAGNKVSARAS